MDPICEACLETADPADQKDIDAFIQSSDEWILIDEDNTRKLTKVYEFPNFQEAQDYTNKVGMLAEDVGHHPVILLQWGSVQVTWWSHKIKDLHPLDLILAERCDQAYNKTN
jgi:4a-hydroxytetrahydrobiopterin dehydratase